MKSDTCFEQAERVGAYPLYGRPFCGLPVTLLVPPAGSNIVQGPSAPLLRSIDVPTVKMFIVGLQYTLATCGLLVLM